MFRTKQEVDKYISDSLRKINTETERNLRCFFFAKLYYNVGDYEQSIRYVTSYLSVKPKSPEGHNLLGKALENLGRTHAALEAYKSSLQQDPKQNTLVLKVCELMSKDDVGLDNSGARYFCELAQSLDPHNPIVSNLKQKLITNVCKDPSEVTEFLLKELENRPMDVNLRVKLLKHFLENNLLNEAYKHAFAIEQKKFGIFDKSIIWYETFAEVLIRYQKEASISSQLTWEFWFFSACVLEKLAALSLDEHIENVKSGPDYVTAVFNFDQSLLKASQGINSCPDKTLVKEFLNHYEAQLCLHFSILAFKQAKRDLVTFKEVQNIILPLLFVAYNSPVPDTKGVWFNNLAENKRLMVSAWYNEASFRCSQAGNVLLGMAKDKKNILLEKANQSSTGMWREKVFKQLFVKRDHQLKSNTSYFSVSSLEPVINLPEYNDIINFNEVSQILHPNSLHHYIWLTLNYHDFADFELKSFDGLQYSPKNTNNCAAETISILDVQSFILCAVLCAQSKTQDHNSSMSYFAQNRPPVLPAAITGNLGTLNQSKFITAVYKMYKHENTLNNAEIRMILIKGIEVVRCVGNHGLDLKLLVALGTIFSDRSRKFIKQSENDANGSRAELYWRAALPMLEKLKNEHAIIYPNNRLFEYKSNKELTPCEIDSFLEKGQLFLGVQLMKKKENEKALKIFEKLRDPYASFHQYQIIRQMAEAKPGQNKDVTPEMANLLWTKARDCLYLTLDRLREPSRDRDHPLNATLGTEIEKVERVLSRLQNDSSGRTDFDEIVSDDEQYLSTYTHQLSFQNGRDGRDQSLSARNQTMQHHSTPLRLTSMRQEARPSPERLDAQIRQLMASESLAMSSIQEQNKMMAELRTSTSEIRDAVKTLTTAMTNIGDVKKMVNELTNSVDDRLQSVTDMVQEMRRELNEIKKDQSKNPQISVEDLYDLDPDYNSPLDYNLSSTLNQTQPSLSNIYSNYPRIPQAPNPNMTLFGGQALYPPIFPGLPYPYGHLGLGQPGAVPFLPQVSTDQQHLAQLPNIPGLTQPVYPSTSIAGAKASQAQNLQMAPKESPKTNFAGANLAQPSFGFSPSHHSSQQSLVQIKEPQKVATQTTGGSANMFLGQSLMSQPVASSSSANVQTSKAPPVNVVITSSDPLPTFSNTTTAQPILSVTIPPQHIKGNTQKVSMPLGAPAVLQPHNYQIPLPAQPAISTTPSVLSQPAPFVATESLLTNVPSPAFSAIAKTPSPLKNVYMGTPVASLFENPKSEPSKFSPLVVSSQNTLNVNTPRKNEEDVDDFVPTAEFKPVVEKLPDLVEVKTGEEDAEVMLEERCKLFRMDTSGEKKEWKERGLGNIKILKENTIRLVMRREQVHKVCLNHQVLKNMIFKKNTTDQKAVVWHAQDFSEGVLVAETFTARFKTPDLADKFLKVIQNLQTTLDENSQVTGKHHKAEYIPKVGFGEKFKAAKGSWECKNCYIINEGKASSVCVACETPKAGSSPKKEQPTFSFGVKAATSTDTKKTEARTGWGNQFKPPSGSWDCKICYVNNSADKTKCISCETPKEGADVSETSSGGLKGISLNTGGQKFNFGMPSSNVAAKPEQLIQKFSFSVPSPATKLESTTVPSGFGDSFKPKQGTWECKSCYVRNEPTRLYCLSCESSKDDSVPKKESPGPKGVNLDTPGLKFNFGMPAASTGSTNTFAFGDTNAPKTTFTWKPADPSVSDSKEPEKEEKFTFGSPQKHDFEFKPRSPRRVSTGQGEESDAGYVEEEEANVYFKPVVPLPDIVEVKTGEENEQVLYSHRAKLYRFSAGEWKERGLGDVKVLKDPSNKKLRVVMRREQILKICLNHWLTKDIDYLAKDEKTWLFHAADFSEGEISRDRFCLRFKDGQAAKEFKKAIDDALGGVNDGNKKIDDKNQSDTDSDVEFISETKVTPEEEKEAIRLGLPPKFLTYRQRPDCTCMQCQKDDEYLRELFNKEPTKTVSSLGSGSASFFGTPKTHFGTPSSAGSVFGSPASSFSFGTPTGDSVARVRTPKTETLKSLLQKPSMVTSNTSESSYSFKSGSTPAFLNLTKKDEQLEEKSAPEVKLGESTPTSVFGLALQKSTSEGGSISSTPENIFKTAADNMFKTTSATSIFGGGGQNPFASASSNLFGSNKDNIFSGPTTTTPTLPIDDNSKSLLNASGKVFPTGGNIFQSGSNYGAGHIFGSSTGSFFASKPETASGGLFGTGSQSATNIFGSSNQGSIFGSTTKPRMGDANSGQTLFGNKAEPKLTDANLTFGLRATTDLKETDEPVLKVESGLSFATLAAKSGSEKLAFVSSTPSDDKTPFAFLGAGAPVFGGSPTAKKDASLIKEKHNKTETGSDNEEAGTEGDEHDPHFEPIVPLPDQIVVSTGEEEESVLFNERAKLFRYDSNNKEWKERGVGQFKVLLHPQNKTYRFLLRREQVHKVVLNQRINPDLEIQPMSTSDKAWIWVGMNYCEEEAKLEKLAVKFKNTEVAQTFKNCMDKTIKSIADEQANTSQDYIPTTVTELNNRSDNTEYRVVESEDHEDEYGDDDEDDDGDYEEEVKSIMFTQACNLSEQTSLGWQHVCNGELQVYYDPEMYTARTCVISENGETVCSTMIAINTSMEIKGNECTWKSVDWSDLNDIRWRTFKATFNQESSAQEFHSNYLEGLNYAHEVGAVDEIPNGECSGEHSE